MASPVKEHPFIRKENPAAEENAHSPAKRFKLAGGDEERVERAALNLLKASASSSSGRPPGLGLEASSSARHHEPREELKFEDETDETEETLFHPSSYHSPPRHASSSGCYDSPTEEGTVSYGYGSPLAAAAAATTTGSKKKPPATPFRAKQMTNPPECVKAARQVRTLISTAARLRIPIHIKVAQNMTMQFTNIQFLADSGEHSVVYKADCDGRTVVLKTYQTEDDPRMLSQMTCQFMRYCQSRECEVVGEFIPRYDNFEPLYQSLKASGFFDEERDFEELYMDLKPIVKANRHGLIVMPFVARPFFRGAFNRSTFDKRDPAWISLKALFKACYDSGICHDLNGDNIYLDEDNNVVVVDLYERDQEDNFSYYYEKYMTSYGIPEGDNEIRDWLCPWRVAHREASLLS